jgi:AraC family transcriptional regulator
MMTSTPNTIFENTGVPRNPTDKLLADIQQIQAQADFGILQSDDPALFNPTIQVTPVESIKRLGTGWRRWFAESIYSPSGNKVEFRFQGPAHLLVLYHEGARRDGETTIDGLNPSRARSFVNKLTFVPAGHAYRERHETSVSTRMTFLYIDPAKLLKSDGTSNSYTPRIYCEDPIVCETAAKMRNAIESGEPKNVPYLEALSNVLAHELSRPDGVARSYQLSRGGLASWQKNTVIRHIEDHLSEQICLATLARLVRLSEHHFCRSFKQSFGVPPHQYHVQRRMESAKVLLADRTISITEIGLIVGYSQASSFSVAFRKMTGWAPNEYRRKFR